MQTEYHSPSCFSMRPHAVFLLGAVAFLAASSADSHSANPNFSVSSRDPSAHSDDAQSGRGVRSGDIVDENDDEKREFTQLYDLDELEQVLQLRLQLGTLDSSFHQEKSPDHVQQISGLDMTDKTLFSDPNLSVRAAYSTLR